MVDDLLEAATSLVIQSFLLTVQIMACNWLATSPDFYSHFVDFAVFLIFGWHPLFCQQLMAVSSISPDHEYDFDSLSRL